MPLGRWFSSAEVIPRENCEQVVSCHHFQHLGGGGIGALVLKGMSTEYHCATAGEKECALLYTVMREAFSNTVTLEERPEELVIEPCRCLGKETTRQRDQEVLRL